MKKFRLVVTICFIAGLIVPPRAAGATVPVESQRPSSGSVTPARATLEADRQRGHEGNLCEHEGPGWRCGYIHVPARDGAPAVDLFYRLRLPVESDFDLEGEFVELPGPFPTALVYHAYGNSYDGAPTAKSLTARGFAVMIVTVRGASCSSGVWYPFSKHEALDGKYIIDEWIPTQPWSNGDVAMVGESASAITQVPVAATQPEHLRAIVPLKTTGDLYRDVLYPGGIFNRGLAAAFPAVQAALSSLNSSRTKDDVSNHQDPSCGENQLSHHDPAASPLVDALTHPHDDEYWRALSPSYEAAKVDVPVLLHTTWQDQVLSSRALESLSEVPQLHAIVSNGTHWRTEVSDQMKREVGDFLDHYVLGVDNGYDQKPRVQVWWETNMNGEPGWTTDIAQWPAPQAKDKSFFLSGSPSSVGRGVLEEDLGRVASGSASYAYMPPTGDSNLNGTEKADLPTSTWSIPAVPGASLTYTSAPLAEDMMVLGSGSLDLSLASTAIDTDLQVTITEVRASGGSGEEVFVQQGWLRASHRALDEERSRPTMPYHTHEKGHAQFLSPGQPTEMRIAIFPFGHVFRAGSQVRITMTPPKTVTDYWSLDALPIPAVNTIFHDPTRPSRLVLPVIPGRPENMPADPPACGSVLAQPCRMLLP